MTTEDEGDRRVDDLRRQLRALGYLDAGVDRFVLGAVHATRRPSAIAALSSLRVGALAAILLGPAAAVGIASRLPGLITGVRDAAMAAAYLGVIFGVALTAFTFLVSIAVARVFDATTIARARRTSRLAGALVAVGCLVYLTLWWSTTTGLAWSAPVWTLFALGVASTISVLLGHAVAITSFAVIAARGRRTGRSTGESLPTMYSETPTSPRSTWRLVVAAGVLAFIGATVLLILTAPASRPQQDAPPLAVVSPGVPIIVVAIDGFDSQVLRSVGDAGQSARLALRTDHSLRFPIGDARDPARVWMTIATGQPPEVHGVRGLETRRVAGVQGALAAGSDGGMVRTLRGTTDLLRLTRPAIASGMELYAKPFWEVAADAGLRAAVVNWWATWPAVGEGANAPLVVSDRAPLRLARGGWLDAEIAPPELYERLRRDWPAIAQGAARLASYPPLQSADTHMSAVLRRSAELDALQVGLASRLLADKPDLLTVYLPGLDIAQHTLLGGVTGIDAATMSARIEGLRRYHFYLDALVGGNFIHPSAATIVVTHPGRLASGAQGTVFIKGSFAGDSANLVGLPVDIAPTILHALGVPISAKLAGRPILQLFSPSFVERFPVREVPTYGERRAARPAARGEPLDAEALERLRSLGYVR